MSIVPIPVVLPFIPIYYSFAGSTKDDPVTMLCARVYSLSIAIFAALMLHADWVYERLVHDAIHVTGIFPVRYPALAISPLNVLAIAVTISALSVLYDLAKDWQERRSSNKQLMKDV